MIRLLSFDNSFMTSGNAYYYYHEIEHINKAIKEKDLKTLEELIEDVGTAIEGDTQIEIPKAREVYDYIVSTFSHEIDESHDASVQRLRNSYRKVFQEFDEENIETLTMCEDALDAATNAISKSIGVAFRLKCK